MKILTFKGLNIAKFISKKVNFKNNIYKQKFIYLWIHKTHLTSASRIITAVAFFMSPFAGAVADAAPSAKYTVSGISSGAFMAQQMATIFSSQFSGAGSIAGGFYGCAGNHLQDQIKFGAQPFWGIGEKNLFLFELRSDIIADLALGQKTMLQFSPSWMVPSFGNPIYQAVTVCMKNPQVAELPNLEKLYSQRHIENPKNIESQKIYLYHGDKDSVVSPSMIDKTQEHYLGLLKSSEQILIRKNPAGAHTFPTKNKKLGPCDSQSIPYLSNCEFDLALEMLEFLYSKSSNISNIQDLESSEKSDTKKLKGSFFTIDQTLNKLNIKNSHYLKSGIQPTKSLAPFGYMYASESCLNSPEACPIHVALHGCEMSDSFDKSFDEAYQKQVLTKQETHVLPDNPDSKSQKLLSISSRVPQMGTKQFAFNAGYAEAADKLNLIILFPQTWINETSYPYNPKGCWDWIGYTGENYATQNGEQPAWMMNFLNSFSKDPKSFIIEKISL